MKPPGLFDEPSPAPAAKLRLVVAYDGTDFHGFAAQPDVRTVAGVLAPALEKVLRQPADITCAGRTDAGVHAWGQVVSLPCDPDADPGRLKKALNGMLAPEVVVRGCEVVGPDFDARHSARWRAYRYTVVNRPEPDPFLARYAWWVPGELRVEAMQLGADPFVGEHDFAAFCRTGPPGSTTVRRIEECRWVEAGDGIHRLEIRATAFCWQMVRSIVGTLVDIGTGARRAGEVMGMLRARDRSAAGKVAPPQGLCLYEVGY
ncbi:MAG TPA: tRNA pseudouridine(38-40) synthase TruA [Acidimicrobiia bacterium]|nr:tRNA pseudouridine(38-40) synthase TruA [Acidimicrobiia bacterium]